MSFSKDFLWGAASAAFQVEGAYQDDGKGLGIWDALADGHVLHNDNGNVACDHYHRYKEDVALMKAMGLQCYRFSVSWPRVMPAPGVINEAGLRFYSDLVDELLAAGITPMVTLYHWNLPMWLHERGGWHNETIADALGEFAALMADRLSDRVKHWITLNEPACFIGLGYMSGPHAPFESAAGLSEQETKDRLGHLTRHTLLAHGKAVQALRAHAKQPLLIGMALNGTLLTPDDETPEAIERARAYTVSTAGGLFQTSWWADPAMLGQVPPELAAYLSDADMAVIHQPLDFFGFNCYYSSNFNEYEGPNPRVKPGMPRTAMGWPVTPEALYWAPRFFTERYGVPFLMTENGMANLDFVMHDGQVHDPQRIEFLRRYLLHLQRAADEGYPMLAYCYWSLMDNFEWADGYDRRFGLIHVDYETQVRTMKDSARWYADVIRKGRVD